MRTTSPLGLKRVGVKRAFATLSRAAFEVSGVELPPRRSPAAAAGPAIWRPVVSSTDATNTRPSRAYAYFFPSGAHTRLIPRVVGKRTRGSPAGSGFTHTFVPAPGPAS